MPQMSANKHTPARMMRKTKPLELLLVGASGRVGRMVSRAWEMQPPPDANITRQFRQLATGPDYKTLIWDPRKGTTPLHESCAKPDVMIILAGVTPRPNAPLLDNAPIAKACLEAAIEIGCGRVLLASSSAIYGAGTGVPLLEDTPLCPHSDYGIAKRDMENTALDSRNHGLDVCCLRIGNVLGADALMLNAKAATNERPLMIDRFASGSGPVRSYIDPAALAQVLYHLATLPEPLPFVLNVGCPKPVAMEHLATAADIPWTWQDAGNSAVEHITLDTSRLAKLHAFGAKDCDPSQMVTRLKQLGAPL